MCRERLLVAALAWLCFGALGCSQSPATQLIVVVDTDYAIPGGIDEIDVDVQAPDGTHHLERQPMASSSQLPYTLTVVPNGSALGPIRIEASGLHAGTVVVSRLGRVTLVARQTLMVRLDLLHACDATSVSCTGIDQTCDGGHCGSIDLTPVAWPGTASRIVDSGVASDASSGTDGAMPDGGTPVDASSVDSGGGCTTSACDDGNACTDDVCDAMGRCTHTPNSTACDDGLFCDGTDLCGGGSCSIHSGNPCGGPTCDEMMRHCGSCATDADCPAQTMGAYGACGGFADACTLDGTQTRTIQTFHCTMGTCSPTMTTDPRACVRGSTDGVMCGATTCGSFGTCGGGASTCATTGTHSRTCTDLVCAGGTCGSVMRTDTAMCALSPSGTVCMPAVCGAWTGACSYVGNCHPSTMQSRSCTDYTCDGTGACVASPAMRIEMQQCPIAPSGTVCTDSSIHCGVYHCNATGGCVQFSGGCSGSQVCCNPPSCSIPAAC